jgi:hypothetical protein
LYYNILTDSTVELTSQNTTYPYYTSLTGILAIPEEVTNIEKKI